MRNAIVTRRQLLTSAGAACAVPLIANPAQSGSNEPARDSDGLYTQPWFHQSFLDLREDLAEAERTGKRFAVLWEQRGCPYCRELHRVNFAEPEIRDYVKKNFVVLQLNLYGSREVTDFDGKAMEERKLARRWRVNFTPTLNFFPASAGAANGKSGLDAEAWRLMGYWKPFHFHSTFVYVKEDGPARQPNFQRWLSGYADKLRAKGKKVKLW